MNASVIGFLDVAIKEDSGDGEAGSWQLAGDTETGRRGDKGTAGRRQLNVECGMGNAE